MRLRRLHSLEALKEREQVKLVLSKKEKLYNKEEYLRYMIMKLKSGKLSPVILLDLVGFALILLSAIIIRYASDSLLQISAGLIGALGIAVLGIARYIVGLPL